MENNIILEKSLSFSKNLLCFLETCDNGHLYRNIKQQCLRSGLSIGAQVAEAQSAQSLADFLSKMKIADKEAKETLYWFRIIATKHPDIEIELLGKLNEIQRLLGSIILTSTRKLRARQARK